MTGHRKPPIHNTIPSGIRTRLGGPAQGRSGMADDRTGARALACIC